MQSSEMNMLRNGRLFDFVKLRDDFTQMPGKRKLGIAVGIALLMLGVSRRGRARPLLLAGGLGLLARLGTDRPITELIRWLPRCRRTEIGQKYGDGERDLVDEASWESFPASDPPAFSPGPG